MSSIPTLWFDKDGTLAMYDYSLYEPEYDSPAPWLVHNAHVFRHLPPYPNMCEAVRRLYAETRNVKPSDRVCNVRVLTAVSDGVTLAEHVIDGAHWCEDNIGLQNKDFYACAVAKESVPVVLRSKIDRYDILFDDYMPNLEKWYNSGGTAIKVVNGVNSPTNAMPFLWVSEKTEDIYKMLMYVVSKIKLDEVIPAVNLNTLI